MNAEPPKKSARKGNPHENIKFLSWELKTFSILTWRSCMPLIFRLSQGQKNSAWHQHGEEDQWSPPRCHFIPGPFTKQNNVFSYLEIIIIFPIFLIFQIFFLPYWLLTELLFLPGYLLNLFLQLNKLNSDSNFHFLDLIEFVFIRMSLPPKVTYDSTVCVKITLWNGLYIIIAVAIVWPFWELSSFQQCSTLYLFIVSPAIQYKWPCN